MFEETIRTLRNLDGPTSIPVSISYDEEGYFDRQCPSEECEFQFKVLLEDWKAKVCDEEVFCPFCGHAADSTGWNTIAWSRFRFAVSINGAIHPHAAAP